MWMTDTGKQIILYVLRKMESDKWLVCADSTGYTWTRDKRYAQKFVNVDEATGAMKIVGNTLGLRIEPATSPPPDETAHFREG